MAGEKPLVRKSIAPVAGRRPVLAMSMRRLMAASSLGMSVVYGWIPGERAERRPAEAAPARGVATVAGVLVGLLLVGGSTWWAAARDGGWQAIGPIAGIALVVFSLFGDLPDWIAWTQRLGAWLFPGVAVATFVLLLPLIAPAAGRPTSLVAFSPTVWAAYLSIVLVGISFEASSWPQRLYRGVQRLPVRPSTLVPLYVVVAGLLGNILDGVSIMAISVVIFLCLLPRVWAVRASFALLFGGLISNLITVAAEPTNIKFQDALHGLLDRVTPPYWFTNWPISILGILAPALWLGALMRREGATWRPDEPDAASLFALDAPHVRMEATLGLLAPLLLAAGIVAHSVLQAVDGPASERVPLWVLVAPAGVMAIIHLATSLNGKVAARHIRHEWPVWGKLMIIFSLLWFLGNGLASSTSVLAAFFTWPHVARYGLMVVLSLASSITDNVALAAMQASILLKHPETIWQIRLLFVLLTWSGGFTPFGCLQSLAVNSRLRLSTGGWFRETLTWAGLSLAGGLAGLAAIALIYPGASGLLR